jgi:uncharacterized protein
MRKNILFLVILIIFLSCNNNKTTDFPIEANEVISLPNIPDAPRWIDDGEDILTKEQEDTLNLLCGEIFDLTKHIPMINTVLSVEPYSSLNEYTSAVDNAWKDESQRYFIFIISDKLMEIRIIQGEITEQIIPAEVTNSILDKNVYPEFIKGNYYVGIANALKVYKEILLKKK